MFRCKSFDQIKYISAAKPTPPREYLIRQIVVHIVLVVVGDKTDGRTNVHALLIENGRRLEDVGVVVRPDYPKICMQNPQPVVSYDFEDHRGILVFEAGHVHLFPGDGAVLPFPMDTIYATQHSGNSCTFTCICIRP